MDKIRQRLESGNLPLKGITPLGSAEFHFMEPARYLGVALHCGRNVRPDLKEAMEIPAADRFREEDPYTDLFIEDFPIRILARDSRFEFDLNWEMEKSIYSPGEQKWGLQVWNRELTDEEKELTYSKFREFHALLDLAVEFMLGSGPPVVIFDMHSFCYQRDQKTDWTRDGTPGINLGTRYINRKFFSPLIDTFLEGISETVIEGHLLRVAENELFPGGYLTRKYSRLHSQKVLVLAIEYKKIFMDEWSGEFHMDKFHILRRDFIHAKERVMEML
jgi:N-formylglutamate deformylase